MFLYNRCLENTLECFRTLAFVGPDFSVYVPSYNKANEGFFFFFFRYVLLPMAHIENIYLGALVTLQIGFSF